MNPKTCLWTAVLGATLILAAPGQNSLTTTFAGGNGCSGNYFDITALNDVTICSFDVSLDTGVSSLVEVWAVTLGGTHQGLENNAAAWTLIGTQTVNSAGNNLPTPLDLMLGFPIAAAATQGFFIRSTSGTNMNYTDGVTLGSVYASDANLQIHEGAYACATSGFTIGSATAVRIWNGTVIYSPGVGIPCPATPAREWQVNSPTATLTVDGMADPGFAGPIVATRGVGAPSMLDLLSSRVGLPWEIYATVPEVGVPLSAGGIATAGGQTINLDGSAPSLFAVFGQTFALPWPGALSVPLGGLATGTAFSAQSLHFDPAHPDGAKLSHLVRFEVQSCDPVQDFENLAANTGASGAAGPYPIGWSNGGGTAEWQVFTGTTTSGSTGPLAGAFSGANYMYCETSSPNTNGAVFEMDTCYYPLAMIPTFNLSFRLSRIGATVGSLEILVDDGTGTFPNVAATYTGAEPTGADWTLESIDLLPYLTGAPMAVRFRYTSGTSFTGDVAIDDVRFQ